MSNPTIRVADAATVKRINERALKHNLNRSLSDMAVENLDPEGYSVVTMLIHHNTANGYRIADHYRCQMLLKLTDDEQPHAALLDIFPDDFDSLPLAQGD